MELPDLLIELKIHLDFAIEYLGVSGDGLDFGTGNGFGNLSFRSFEDR